LDGVAPRVWRTGDGSVRDCGGRRGCAQSGATDGRTASAIRDRDSETIKPAGYINPDPAWTQDYRG